MNERAATEPGTDGPGGAGPVSAGPGHAMRAPAGAAFRRAWAGFLAGDPDTGWYARLVGTIVLVVTLATARPSDAPGWAWACYAVAGLGWSIFVVVGSRHPRLSLGSLAAAAVVCACALGLEDDGTALILACVSLAGLASHARAPLAGIVGLGLVVLALAWASLLLWHRADVVLLTYPGVLAFVVLSGLYRRQYHVRVQQTEALLEQTRLAQAEHARAAALNERARIAREIHDVLAHSLGALGVQLEVAEALLSERSDPEGALDRVRRSRRLAGDGLAEARNAVAALRTDVPSLPDALAELADAHRRDHGVAVEVSTSGDPRAVSSAAAVSLLGTTREALTNAGKHAPGAPVRIDLDYGAEAIRLLIRNTAHTGVRADPGQEPGHGLAGMRERLALAGGTLHTRREPAQNGAPGSVWLVEAEVPE